MTKQQILIRVAMVVTMLSDAGGWLPASSIYVEFGCDIHEYQKLIGLMVASGLVTSTSEVVTITDKGRELAADCAELVAA